MKVAARILENLKFTKRSRSSHIKRLNKKTSILTLQELEGVGESELAKAVSGESE